MSLRLIATCYLPSSSDFEPHGYTLLCLAKLGRLGHRFGGARPILSRIQARRLIMCSLMFPQTLVSLSSESPWIYHAVTWANCASKAKHSEDR
jgi:hypothetical protein